MSGKFIHAVDRSRVDRSRYLDVGGLRLYCASEAVQRKYQDLLPKLPRYFFRTLLTRVHADSGVEFDRVPVRGEEGKKSDTKNMVLIKRGAQQLTSERTHDIVRRIHAKGGVVCAMCDGIAAVQKDLRGKTCRYWDRRKQGVPKDEEQAPVVVDKRIITTAGQAVAVPTAVVLLELLCGKEVADTFVTGCPCMFGFDAEFACKVRVHRADT